MIHPTRPNGTGFTKKHTSFIPGACQLRSRKELFSAGPALARRERRPYGIRIENAGYGHVYGLDSTQSKVPVFRSQKPWPGFSTTLLILEPQLPRADFMKLA